MSHKQVWTVVLATAAIVASPGPGVALQAGRAGTLPPRR
jgi:threonine/homoserine/homoserine lactone efflux protein